jgi:hypothetical protein
MDIIKHRSMNRLSRIAKTKDAIVELLKEEKEIDWKAFEMEIISSLGISKGTAKEYIEIAKYQAKV